MGPLAHKGEGFYTELQACFFSLSGNFLKPFVAVSHTPLLQAHLVRKLDCCLPCMVLVKNLIYMPKVTVATLLIITHKYN